MTKNPEFIALSSIPRYTYNPITFKSSQMLSYCNYTILRESYEIIIDNAYKPAIKSHYIDFDNITHSNKFNIPPISHHIWLTNPNAPREVRMGDLLNLKNTIELIDNSTITPWQHFFWINCKACLPDSLIALSQLNLEIRHLEDYASSLSSHQIVSNLITANAIGVAVDIIREDIVNVYGGFYSDLNYVIFKSPEFLMHNYNFFAPGDSSGIENYMFASSAQHPILTSALNTSLFILSDKTFMSAFQDSNCSYNQANDFFAYDPFINAFRMLANKQQTLDYTITIPRTQCYSYEIETASSYEEYLLAFETNSAWSIGYDSDVDAGSWIIDNDNANQQIFE